MDNDPDITSNFFDNSIIYSELHKFLNRHGKYAQKNRCSFCEDIVSSISDDALGKAVHTEIMIKLQVIQNYTRAREGTKKMV